MKTEDFYQQVINQQHEIKTIHQNSTELIARDQLNLLKELMVKKPIKVILGVRRAGKSTLIIQAIANKSFIYFNFDDELLSQANITMLDDLVSYAKTLIKNPDFIFFDEIQNIQGWELFVNKLHRRNENVLITGSNSRLLGKELATHLTGRQLPLELLPFSYSEFLSAKKYILNLQVELTLEQKKEIEKYYLDFLTLGGFPEIINENPESSFYKLYIKELYDKIISRDIAQRRNIKNLKALKEIALHVMSLYASLFTYQSLKRASSINSINTVKNYVEYLLEAYLGFVIEPFSYKVKERISLPKKFYLIDLSFADVILNKATLDKGRKLENAIYLELRRLTLDIYYIKKPTYEIDFIIREGRRTSALIQVAWEIESEEARNRELNALVKASAEFNCEKLIVITFETEQSIEYQNKSITVIPAWKFAFVAPQILA